MFSYTFLLLFIIKNCFHHFLFFFFNEVSNFRTTILPNQKQETRNCLLNSMRYSSSRKYLKYDHFRKNYEPNNPLSRLPIFSVDFSQRFLLSYKKLMFPSCTNNPIDLLCKLISWFLYDRSVVRKPFIPSAPFLYPLKTSENCKVF